MWIPAATSHCRPGAARRSPTDSQLVVDVSRRARIRACACRPQCVVLVNEGEPERRHHFVADEFLDDTAVALDDLGHFREEATHDLVDRFGVKALAERREPGHVREQNRNGLASKLRRRRRGRSRVPHAEQKRAPSAANCPTTSRTALRESTRGKAASGAAMGRV